MNHEAAESLAAISNADPQRPFVVAQLGQSLDGRIATTTGESRWINGSAALDHLHRLRAAVDAVVVGIGTVIADDPQLNVRRIGDPATQPKPARIVIDPSGRLPSNAKVLASDGAEILAINATDCEVTPPCPAIKLDRSISGLCPVEMVRSLFARGFKRLLIEGGAHTVSRFIDARAVDRLHVLVAPMLIGSGKTGIELTPVARLDRALRPPTKVHVLADGDVLFDCDLAAARANLSDESG